MYYDNEKNTLWKKGSPPEAGHPIHCRAFLVCSHVEGGTSLLPGNGTVQWPGAVQAHKGARPLTKGLCLLGADITRQSLSGLIKGCCTQAGQRVSFLVYARRGSGPHDTRAWA